MRFLLALVLTLSQAAMAGTQLENWQNGDGIRLVVRNDQGKFISHGELSLESWNDGDDVSEWVARLDNGQFVSGFKGHLEKFKVKGLAKEQTRLVIRNSKGHFVTWMAMDALLTAGFEAIDLDRDGDKETVYVVRYNGKFVNWAKASLENWSNFAHPVLVVRDTADSHNNGKLLAWIAPTVLSNGNVIYRDAETGRFVSHNK
jgi:hypothetical protein